MAGAPSWQKIPLSDSVLSVATGFLRHKVNRSPRICFDGKRNKGGIARQGGGLVKEEGKREDPEVGLGSERDAAQCCHLVVVFGAAGT